MQDAVGIRGSGPGAILRKLTDLVREVSPVDALQMHCTGTNRRRGQACLYQPVRRGDQSSGISR